MDDDPQIGKYLERAREAEARASLGENKAQKNEWREIANAYRNLAQARLLWIAASGNRPTPPDESSDLCDRRRLQPIPPQKRRKLE
jgi:hypothetical protein